MGRFFEEQQGPELMPPERVTAGAAGPAKIKEKAIPRKLTAFNAFLALLATERELELPTSHSGEVLDKLRGITGAIVAFDRLHQEADLINITQLTYELWANKHLPGGGRAFEQFAENMKAVVLQGTEKYAGAAIDKWETIDIYPLIFGEAGYITAVMADLTKRVMRYNNQRRERDLVKIGVWCYLIWSRYFFKERRTRIEYTIELPNINSGNTNMGNGPSVG